MRTKHFILMLSAMAAATGAGLVRIAQTAGPDSSSLASPSQPTKRAPAFTAATLPRTSGLPVKPPRIKAPERRAPNLKVSWEAMESDFGNVLERLEARRCQTWTTVAETGERETLLVINKATPAETAALTGELEKRMSLCLPPENRDVRTRVKARLNDHLWCAGTSRLVHLIHPGNLAQPVRSTVEDVTELRIQPRSTGTEIDRMEMTPAGPRTVLTTEQLAARYGHLFHARADLASGRK